MQSRHGRLKSRAELWESIDLTDALRDLRREEGILGDIHPVSGSLVYVINLTSASIIETQMELPSPEFGGVDRPACGHGDVGETGLEPPRPCRTQSALTEPILSRSWKIFDHIGNRDDTAYTCGPNVIR